jgi:TonB family protein
LEVETAKRAKSGRRLGNGGQSHHEAGRTARIFVLGLLFVSSHGTGQTAGAPPNQADVAKHMETGREALRQGRFERAIRAFEHVDRFSGGSSAPAFLGIAAAQLQMARFDEAAQTAEKALAVASEIPDQATAHNLVGTALWGLYNTAPEQEEDPALLLRKAESEFGQALQLSGGNLNIAWSNLALVLEKEGRFADAESVLQEYVERVPESQSAKERLVVLQEQQEFRELDQQWIALVSEGQLAEAVDVIEQHLSRSSNYPRAQSRLCWLRVAGFEVGEIPRGGSNPDAAIAETRAKAVDLPVKVEGDVAPPEFLEGPEPNYTDEARTAQIFGKVVLEAVIDKQGSVQCAAIVEDLPLGLGQSAVEAVEKWHFEPATRNGQSVNVKYTFTIGFSVD